MCGYFTQYAYLHWSLQKSRYKHQGEQRPEQRPRYPDRDAGESAILTGGGDVLDNASALNLLDRQKGNRRQAHFRFSRPDPIQ